MDFIPTTENTPDNVKFKGKSKLEDRILVGCAISESGFISQPYIGCVPGEALTADLYIQRCLSKLLQFSNTHHANDDTMFWPYLASCHYARPTREWFNANNINFVSKLDNPPNVTQARPIEDFWSMLSRKVYDKGCEAANEEQLRHCIFQKIRELNFDFVQVTMQQVRRKSRAIEDNSPLSCC